MRVRSCGEGGGECARARFFILIFLIVFVMFCIKMFVNFCMFCALVYYRIA